MTRLRDLVARERTGDATPPVESTVLFPTVGGGQVNLLRASCLRVTDWDNSERPVRAPGFSDAIVMLIEARAEESPGTMELGVLVRRESRDFQGDSCGLAVALADKFVRFRQREPERTVLATGALRPGGRGAVAPVAGFNEKTLGLLDHIRTRDIRNAIYLFAAANKPDLTEETYAALGEAEHEMGLECRPLLHLSEAADLWSAAPAPRLRGQRRPPMRWAVIGSLAMAVAAAGGVGGWLLVGPKRALSPMAACVESVRDGDPAKQAFDNAFAQGNFGLDVAFDRTDRRYQIGTDFAVRVSVFRDAYIRVVSRDSNGGISVLVPSALVSPLQFKPLRLHVSPPPGAILLSVSAAAGPIAAPSPGSGALANLADRFAADKWQEKSFCLEAAM